MKFQHQRIFFKKYMLLQGQNIFYFRRFDKICFCFFGIFFVYCNISTKEISFLAFLENVEQDDIFGKQDIEHHHCRGRRGGSTTFIMYG